MNKDLSQIDKGIFPLLKKLKISAIITLIFCFLSAIALIFLYLALSDIADSGIDLTLEWYVAGICFIILSIFVISTFITLGLLIKVMRVGTDLLVK